MPFFSAIRAIWNMLTGKTVLTSDISEAESYIMQWHDVYRGEPSWLDYTWLGISGQKQTRKRECMNFAKLACAEIAKLVWAENPEIEADKDVLALFEAEDFYNRTSKLTEYGAALGAFAWKLYGVTGADGSATLKIDYVTADFIIPVTVRNGKLVEADFISQFVESQKSYYRIESHRIIPGGYRITNVIREVTGELATMANVEDFGYIPSIDVMTPVPLFVYVANPDANNKNIHSGIGLSIFANALPTLKSLDIAFDSLQHEIVMGIRKIIVPVSCTRTYINPATGKSEIYYDESDEVYVAFNDAEAQGLKIIDNTPELRIEQIRLAINTLINIASNQMGFSQGSFSFDGVSMKTATEVISENSKTYKTMKSFQNSIGAGIVQLVEAIKAIGDQYGIGTTSMKTTIKWNDSVIEDSAAREKRVTERVNSGTMSKINAIMELDGVDEAEATKRYEQIKKEQATIDTESIGVSLLSGASSSNSDASDIIPSDPVEAVKLSGIQITSANEIISKVADGTLTRDAGINQLKIFLGLSQEQADKVMGAQSI